MAGMDEARRRPGPFDERRRLVRFLLAVETGSITEAARRAGMSQPAFGQSLKKLEQRAGGALLVRRGNNGVAPTPLGLAVAAEARTVLAALADAETWFQEIFK